MKDQIPCGDLGMIPHPTGIRGYLLPIQTLQKAKLKLPKLQEFPFFPPNLPILWKLPERQQLLH